MKRKKTPEGKPEVSGEGKPKPPARSKSAPKSKRPAVGRAKPKAKPKRSRRRRRPKVRYAMYSALQMASILEATEWFVRYLAVECDFDPEEIREYVCDLLKKELRRRPPHPDQWPDLEEAIERGLGDR